MIRSRGIFVFLCFLAACAVGTCAQVLSYSTYLPGFAANGSIAAVNNAGESCVAFISTHPFAGAKFNSDGSIAYTIPLDAFASSMAITSGLLATTLVAIDSSGNCYLGGWGQINPTPGAFEVIQKQTYPPWVAKFDGSGKLIFATYISGSGNDLATGISADSAGNVYITGTTSSNDFPTLNAYQPVIAGTVNAFISVLNPTGTGLIYSTYWGGGAESTPSIAVDAARNAYVTGGTSSKNFPLVSPLQSTPGPTFVIKLGPSGAPIFSTYTGQVSFPMVIVATAIAADQNGSAYVTGYTALSTLEGALYNTSVLVNKYSADGSALVYSASLWGTSSISTGIAVDSAGQAYVSGYDQSGYDLSVPLVSPILVGVGNDAFASVVNSTGTALTFSTAVGQGGKALSIGIDSIPNLYVSGITQGYGRFPLLTGTYDVPDPTYNVNQPGFLSKISLSSGTSLSFPNTVDFGQAHIQVGDPLVWLTSS
jgi:Beta-propeller repeat